MELFEVEQARFGSLSEFNAHLAGDDVTVDNTVYIVAGLSQYSKEEFLSLLSDERGYDLEEYGEILKIQRSYQSKGETRTASYYMHYDDSEGHEGGIALFYTNQRKTEEIENTILPLLENERGLHYLHVYPSLFRTVRHTILEEEDYAEITEFVADRQADDDYPSRVRPEIDRTINYYGDDGYEALEEMETNYGVRPRYLEFNIPNVAKFKISREGVFSLSKGDLEVLFEYVQVCVREALEVKEAFDESSFEMVDTTSSLAVPSAKPATIELSGKLAYSELSEVVSEMDAEDYILVDPFGQEGSLYFSTRVYDKQKEGEFRLKASEEKLRVFPKDEEGSLGAFLRFHEFVKDHIDPNASVVVPQ